VLVPGQSGVQGPHQGGYVETPDRRGWFLHFNSTGAFGRITYLEPVRWHDDWPVIGNPIGDGTQGEPVPEYALPVRNPKAQLYHLQDSDEFNSPVLGMQWEWNHNPDDRRWSLTARPGYLRLQAQGAQYLVTARNTVTQILQGPAMTVTARLDLAHLAEQQRAGLVLFGVRPTWIGVVREAGVDYLTYATGGVETRGPNLSSDVIDLKAQVSPDQSVRFSYSTQAGAPFQPFGPQTPLARFSWWKGSRPGLFTYVKVMPESAPTTVPDGFVDIDWFHVEH
jgi:beta-xylosidase